MKTKKQQLQDMDKAFKQLNDSYSTLRANFLKNTYGATSKFCIGVSAGHGGMYNGKYQTNGKQMYHPGMDLHQGGNFYEGVWNRIIADKLCTKLKARKMVYEKFYHEYEDMPLRDKSAMVNKYHANVKKVLLFELHSNATPNHDARGFLIYTGPGQTDSDILADVLWQYVNEFAGDFGIRMRSQKRDDGDHDYEAKFHMCVKTACPTILPECLFFDNPKDVAILHNEEFQDKYVEALDKTAVWGQKNLEY